MPEFLITAVGDQKRPWGDGMIGYRVTLKAGDGTESMNVDLSRKSSQAAPAVGEKVSGDLDTSGSYGPKFKAARAFGGGGGGPRPEDPKKARHIARMHAQDMALQFASLMQTMGKLDTDPEKPFTRKTLGILIDWFEADAAAARDAA